MPWTNGVHGTSASERHQLTEADIGAPRDTTWTCADSIARLVVALEASRLLGSVGMATAHQQLGDFAERLVTKVCSCPRCKKPAGTLRQLPNGFKCADIICDFCGFLAQVKGSTKEDVETLPATLLGAAWGPMEERLEAGVFFPLFLVLVTDNRRKRAVWYLAPDLQTRDMFRPRKPLSPSARRHGWQGFIYHLDAVKTRFVRLA